MLAHHFVVNRITGVEVKSDAQGYILNACTLKLAGQQLKFERKSSGLKGVLHFSKNYPAGAVALCIRGKGVLTKKIDRVASVDQHVINQVLPNANPDDFYFQHYVKDDASYISAIRRGEADMLVSSFSAHGYTVVSLSLDVFVQDTVLSLTDGLLESSLTLAYAVAFQMLLNDDLVAAEHEQLAHNRKEMQAGIKLKAFGLLFSGLIIFMLIVSMLLKNFYTQRFDTLSRQTRVNVEEINRFKGLEKNIAGKIDFIRAVGWTGGLRYAYILDRLMAVMPETIHLQELAVNPLSGLSATDDSQRVYLSKTIRVKGSCAEVGMLNNWFFTLKSMGWVKDCRLTNYHIGQDDGRGDFEMIIQLKDDEA